MKKAAEKSQLELEIRPFRDKTTWGRWLATHPKSAGIWLKIAKKDSGIASVTYPEALEEALCHGWIDGTRRGHDAEFFLQRFTPRRRRSLWSKINVAKVEKLIAQGKMQAGGLREMEAAKASGRWEAAYASARTIEPAPELAEALAKNEKARAAFEALDRTNRYAFCWRVLTLKTAAARRKKAKMFVAMLERGEKLHAPDGKQLSGVRQNAATPRAAHGIS